MKKILLTLTVLSFIAIPSAFAAHHEMNGQTIYADVNGLVCDFCARALEKTFKKEAAIESIGVNLDDKVVTITFKADQSLSHERLEELITSAGYDLERIRHSEDAMENGDDSDMKENMDE